MVQSKFLKRSKVVLELDKNYYPIYLFNKEFEKAVNRHEKTTLVKIAIVRSNDQITTIEKKVFEEESYFFDNYVYIERFVKALLWIKGGYKILYGGPENIGLRLQKDYKKGGKREFDALFIGDVYQTEFTVEIRDINDIPKTFEQSIPMGRHMDGCRIGFDAGGSDRKVSAIMDGKVVFSEEVIWHPKTQSDPSYHYQGILDSMKKAASTLPRVDAIGVSTAGIVINDEIAAASLFRQVPKELFDSKVRPIYKDVAKEIGDVPIKVANDGDVTALAGSMSLGVNTILGIAMGTSEAAGYIDEHGNITGWLNELSFVPVSVGLDGPVDEWSLDRGVGVSYFSQDAVIRLADNTSISLDEKLSPAEKLVVVQEEVENNNIEAKKIFETIGTYLAYSLAYYHEFYDMKHVIILGRVTSKTGGEIVLQTAQNIIKTTFPHLAQKLEIQLPDEKSRRVGQSIAAASLAKR
jgi:predicted NBD/HSP70 family sugar kinase